MSGPSKATPEEFVRAWLGSASVGEVATRLGVSRQSVYVRAINMRKLGVNLPELSRVGAERPDVDALNALITSGSGK